MSVLGQQIEQFLKRGKEQLQKRKDSALMKISDNVEALNAQIRMRSDSSAMTDWGPAKEPPQNSFTPEYFKYGTLQMVAEQRTPDGINIPLLLPTKVNAVMMNLGDDAEKVPNLFQNIIIRLLLSTRMELVKVSVVDMAFGTSFPMVSSINNPMLKCQMVYRQDDITKLINGLAEEISEASRAYRRRGEEPDRRLYVQFV